MRDNQVKLQTQKNHCKNSAFRCFSLSGMVWENGAEERT